MSSARWSLVVAVLGSTMVFLDGTVVNVALPVMQRTLDATVAQMQWIVEAYALMLAALVLVGGALGDRLGRKRVFVLGAELFAAASIGCALAPDATVLIVARALQGIGGALLVPGSLALVAAAHPDRRERARAIGTWSAASSITTAVGPVLGGWVVSHASWRWLFLANAPMGAAIVMLSRRWVAETKDENAPSRIDVWGATCAAVGLGAIVLSLLEAPNVGGLGSPRSLALFAFGAVVLGAFVLVEARVREPMVPLGLFRSRAFAATNVLTFFLYAGLFGSVFFLPFNLVQVQGYTPTAAGASLLPLVVLVSVMSPWTSVLAVRFGPRATLVTGSLVATIGFGLLALPKTGGSYWTTFFPGILVLGVGMGLTVAPLTSTVMGAVEERHAGVASGINNAVTRTGGLLAVAVLGVILAAEFHDALDRGLDALHVDDSVRGALAAQRGKLAAVHLSSIDPASRETVRRALADAYVSGFRVVMLVCA
ncbi:MAG: MFS transporter, partial [Polyangiales bacterium]